MWRFWEFLRGEQTSSAADGGPELLITTQTNFDSERGTHLDAGHKPAYNDSRNDDDNDNDRDDKLPSQNTTTNADGMKIVYTEKFADDFEDDDDDENGERRTTEDEFYQELSDAEPDTDFLGGCYEYLPVGDLCYAIRRVGSGETNILAHESTPLVAFCYALQKASDAEMQRVCNDERAVDENELDQLARNSDVQGGSAEIPAPLGVIGWFVQNVMNDKPVFAFDADDAERKKVIDITAGVPLATNAASVAAGSPTGIALLDNGYKSEQRIEQAFRYNIGLNYDEVLQGRDRRFLRRFERYGETARPASFDPRDGDNDGFVTLSPATPHNGRWFVVEARHYALYKSNEKLVSASGASLSRLAASLDVGTALPLKTLPPGVSQQQARAVFEQYLREESTSNERERERQRFLLLSRLRAKCGQIVGLRAQLGAIKLQSRLSVVPSAVDSDADSVNFLVNSLADIEEILRSLENEQISRF